MPEFQNVAVIGLGYIGLPTAAVIASRGMRVVGVDVNEDVVKTVASGAIHIAEPDLEGLVQKVVSAGSLTAATKPEAADVFIIAVPTPIDEHKRPDLKSVYGSCRQYCRGIAPRQPGNFGVDMPDRNNGTNCKENRSRAAGSASRIGRWIQ